MYKKEAKKKDSEKNPLVNKLKLLRIFIVNNSYKKKGKIKIKN
jgi:hypothetical protein